MIYFKAQLVIEDYIFESDIFTTEGEQIPNSYLTHDSTFLTSSNQLLELQGRGVIYPLLAVTETPSGGVEELPDINVTVKAPALQTERLVGKRATLYLYVKENEWEPFADAGRRFNGVVNEKNLLEDEIMELGIIHTYQTVSRIEGLSWSDRDHQRRNPGDRFFANLHQLEQQGEELVL